MPLLTYYNLSEDKKEKIIRISLEEFANKDYESASLTGIIKQVGVAKGSFYRYFKNKYDLYAFLVSLARETQKEVSHAVFPSDWSFTEYLIQKYEDRIAFALAYPMHCQLLRNMMRERNSRELDNMLSRTQKSIMKEVTSVIKQYQLSGELRSDLDTEMLAYQIVMQEYVMLDFFSFKHRKKVKGSLVQIPLKDIKTGTLHQTVISFVDMLVSGMNPSGAESTASDGLPMPLDRQRNQV